MSKYFKVSLSFQAIVDARIKAETEAEAKGLAEKFSFFESTVLLGMGSNHAETITSEQEILVLDIDEFTSPDQFGFETKEPNFIPNEKIPFGNDVVDEQYQLRVTEGSHYIRLCVKGKEDLCINLAIDDGEQLISIWKNSDFPGTTRYSCIDGVQIEQNDDLDDETYIDEDDE